MLRLGLGFLRCRVRTEIEAGHALVRNVCPSASADHGTSTAEYGCLAHYALRNARRTDGGSSPPTSASLATYARRTAVGAVRGCRDTCSSRDEMMHARRDLNDARHGLTRTRVALHSARLHAPLSRPADRHPDSSLNLRSGIFNARRL